jgi:hypothetical protein
MKQVDVQFAGGPLGWLDRDHGAHFPGLLDVRPGR